ncbi:LysE family translocator [Vibrio palustris]|uniref:Threonine efflux protein n=1 Tax=Vibrio palustris TaxID=1918946 RepID=A0A1R4B6I7_9VIBR|nr:LysE family transporter [Vibrio palustris]SJL84530.1 Threonine efflux protein [Vibrio palustris]
MDWALFSIFVTVAIAHFLALLSPGPDFVLVVKSAIKNGPKKSIGVAAGIASANALYIALCLVGVGALLASTVIIMIALKVAGGLFLIYLAVMALRAKKSDYKYLEISENQTRQSETTFAKEFITGFMSGILNPKNLLFYLSLFTVVLTNDVNFGFKVGLGIWMTSVVFVWDLSVIYVLSIDKVRRKFSKLAYYIDKCTGVILGLIGFTIVKSALTK